MKENVLVTAKISRLFLTFVLSSVISMVPVGIQGMVDGIFTVAIAISHPAPVSPECGLCSERKCGGTCGRGHRGGCGSGDPGAETVPDPKGFGNIKIVLKIAKIVIKKGRRILYNILEERKRRIKKQ